MAFKVNYPFNLFADATFWFDRLLSKAMRLIVCITFALYNRTVMTTNERNLVNCLCFGLMSLLQ